VERALRERQGDNGRSSAGERARRGFLIEPKTERAADPVHGEKQTKIHEILRVFDLCVLAMFSQLCRAQSPHRKVV
jgi:hypothetical protein